MAATATPVMTIPEKVEKGKGEKETGNTFFKQGNYTEALRHYHTATLYLQGLDAGHLKGSVPASAELEQSVKDEINQTLSTCYNNMAACHIKNKKYERAITYCDKVLAKEAENPKALYRRGQSHLALNNLDKAEADLVKACKLAPNDLGIRKELDDLKSRRAVYAEKQKKELAGMFDRANKASE